MLGKMEESTLWQRTFAQSNSGREVLRLVTSLREVRTSVAELTSRISASLPSLTLHDTSHLDALWGVASTIAGDDYVLNPLEGYLFGTSVLLHDVALCYEAYTGGKEAIRSTVQWRDAFNRRLMNQGSVDRDAVDFEALRSLHAIQALTVATRDWCDDEGDPQYIINDPELRTQYGSLIGEIAASHHWNIADVEERFSVPRPPAAFLPQNWVADCLKIACLLRVADAGHMDSSRAPTFLLKILQMNSVSRNHWLAHNHLGQLTVKNEDPSRLVVASTAPFRRTEAPAWWVAFDLVDLFDKELRQCDAVLKKAQQGTGTTRTLKGKGVAGAGNAKELSQYIQTDGWEPTNSTVHVSDAAALVSRLGGEQLYGTSTPTERLKIALRELIQNAADAISARRLIGESNFRGHIRVRVLKIKNKAHYLLQVDDDGVGMSPTTLSEDLLDFGKSFWASERASTEFPGLHAARHSPIGRYGIGFFSMFMAGVRARVYSRRFDRGMDDVRCLSFDNGLSLRPTLSDRKPTDFGMDVCTRVELELKPNVIYDLNRIEIPSTVSGQRPFEVPFNHYVAALVCGIDVPISLEFNDFCNRIHDGFPPSSEHRADWIRSLSYATAGANPHAGMLAEVALPRLREIRDGEVSYGLAALRTHIVAPQDFLSAKSVGGFATHDLNGAFIGLIEHLPASARREPGKMHAPKHAIDRWLSEQVALLENISGRESILTSYSLCEFDYDPIDILKVIQVRTMSGDGFWPLEQLALILKRGRRLGFRVSKYGVDMRLEQYGEQHPISGIATCLVIAHGKFNKADILEDVPHNRISLIGVIHRVLVNQGAEPKWTIRPAMYRGPFGRCDCLEVNI